MEKDSVKKAEESGYNREYDALVKRINSTIAESKRDKNSKILEEFLNENHGNDLSKILMRVDGEIESITDIDENALKVIRDQENGRKLHNRIFIWYMEGTLNPELLMKRYNEFCEEYPAFRTIYIAKGLKKPVKVVLKSEKSCFPIINLTNFGSERRNFIVKNVLAAEMRREYDIERDSILKLQVFETQPNKIIVILSIYAFPGFQFGGIRDFLFKVFEGFKAIEGDVPHVSDPAIERMNKALRSKALAFWEDLINDTAEVPNYPGANFREVENQTESSYYSLGRAESRRFLEFAKSKNVTPETVIIKAWGEILNLYNKREVSAIGMVCKGEALNVVPLVYSNGMTLKRVESKIKETVANTVVSIEEIDDYVSGRLEKYFRVVHNLQDYSIIDDALDNKNNGELSLNSYYDMEKASPALTINYYLFEDSVGINFVYKKNLFVNDDPEPLKDLLLEKLDEIMAREELEELDEESLFNNGSKNVEDISGVDILPTGEILSAQKNDEKSTGSSGSISAEKSDATLAGNSEAISAGNGGAIFAGSGDSASAEKSDDLDEGKTEVNKNTAQAILAKRALVLKSSKLFDCLHISELMDLTKQCEQHSYSCGDLICDEGSFVQNISIISEGQVAHRKMGPNGRLITDSFFEKNDVICLEAINSDGRSNGAYFVESDSVQVLEITKDVFYQFADAHTDIYKAVIEKMSEYMQNMFNSFISPEIQSTGEKPEVANE